jgi:hypothetical protein
VRLSFVSVRLVMSQDAAKRKNIEETRYMILSCNITDEEFYSKMSRENISTIRCTVSKIIRHKGELVREVTHWSTSALDELFIVCLERGWLRSASYVCSTGKLNWSNYALTNALLSNMQTKPNVPVLEFQEFMISLNDSHDDHNGKSNQKYAVCVVRLLDIMTSIQLHSQPSILYDINMKDSKGRSPLFRECQQDSYILDKKIKCWRMLGADLDTVDMHQNTLMHALGMSPNRPCTDSLETLHGFNPRMLFSQNNDGNTPLHLAVMKGRQLVSVSIIKHFFTERGFVYEFPSHIKELEDYMDIRNKYGRSALEMVMQCQFFEQENGSIVEDRNGSLNWQADTKFESLVMCAGLLIVCGAYVSDRVALWLESLSKKEPDCELLQLVAARALTRQIGQYDGISDIQRRVEGIVMDDKSTFLSSVVV